MGYIWGGIFLAAFLFSLLSGNPGALSEALFSGAEEAVSLGFHLLGMMCFWSGILEIAKRAGITEKIAKILSPLLRIIFPEIPPNSKAASAISMNITANLLGLSNAATPLGLAAMKELDAINLHKGQASNAMCLFVVINSASICLMPTTLLTMRVAFGSANPFSILPPVWLCSFFSLFAAICVALYCKKRTGKHL